MIQSLGLPSGSSRAGCRVRIGLQALQLAEAVGPHGQVTGMDILPGLLAFGSEHAKRAGYAGRVTFCAGDNNRLPFEAD